MTERDRDIHVNTMEYDYLGAPSIRQLWTAAKKLSENGQREWVQTGVVYEKQAQTPSNDGAKATAEPAPTA